MEVYALVGPSGTGKSHRAMTVAYEQGINTVIDDGLLIQDGRRVAGSSAKAEKTAIKAVKRAIFLDVNQQNEVKAALAKAAPARLLILGTSSRMADRISEALGLPKPTRYFRIEEVASPKEINAAQVSRKTYGMHVIPVPVVEVKADLQGYLMRPIRYLARLQSGQKQGEKTIVQPRFSGAGKLVISNRALAQIIRFLAVGVPGAVAVSRVQAVVVNGNATIRLELTARLNGYLPRVADDIRRLLQDQIALLCGIQAEHIDILIRGCRR
jgi:uncharacterized alkaline shock family protein YloU